MKAKLSRGEMPDFLNLMRRISGFKKPTTCLNFGRDIRMMREKVEETNDAIETAKPPRYDELLEQFQSFQSEKSKEAKDSGKKFDFNKAMLEFEHADEWMKVNTAYKKLVDGINKEKIEVTFKTVLKPDEIPDVSDASLGEILTYFVK